MRIDVLTIFPSMFGPILNESILKRAQEAGRVRIHIHDIRDYTLDKHRKVDDRPYGGGSGMLLTPQPIFSCVEAILKKHPSRKQKRRIFLLSARGKKFAQKDFKKLASYEHLILICGHYEGIDERVASYLADEEVSIGDYVLTGGELPAMVLIDATCRLLPGVLGNEASAQCESFSVEGETSPAAAGGQYGVLEYPQYTRPSEFKGKKVPSVLLSGDHSRIAEWRKKESLKVTKKRRPELLKKRS